MKFFYLFSIITILLSGCYPVGFTTRVKSVSIANDLTEKTYRIKSINGKKAVVSLREKSRLKIIEKMLSDSGFTKTSSSSPSYNLQIVYGITEPKTKVGASPIIGQTGVSSSTTYGNINSYGSYNSTTYNNPSYGVVGSSTYTYDTYTRFLSVKGLDRRGEEVFDTQAVSAGSSGDIDKVLPILAFNMISYLGKNITKSTDIELLEEDKRLQSWISSINSPQPSSSFNQLPIQNSYSSPQKTSTLASPPNVPSYKQDEKSKLLRRYINKEITKEEYFRIMKNLE